MASLAKSPIGAARHPKTHVNLIFPKTTNSVSEDVLHGLHDGVGLIFSGLFPANRLMGPIYQIRLSFGETRS